jgi:hypothetical protein
MNSGMASSVGAASHGFEPDSRAQPARAPGGTTGRRADGGVATLDALGAGRAFVDVVGRAVSYGPGATAPAAAATVRPIDCSPTFAAALTFQRKR